MEETDFWDPERVRMVGSVVKRYASLLTPGDRVRLEIEGDQCGTYRGTIAPPVGTVTDVHRSSDGTVRFDMRMDGTDEILTRDNVNLKEVWEIDPAYLDTFVEKYRATAEETLAAEEEATPAEDEAAPAETQPTPHQTSYRKAEEFERRLDDVEDANRSLRESLHSVEETNRELKETLTAVVREISGDMMRIFRGQKTEFVDQYVDRYDRAMEDQGEYRGEESHAIREAPLSDTSD